MTQRTEIPTAEIPTAAIPAGENRRARVMVCWATVACMLPYLGLKAAWLCGSGIGITDASIAGSSTLYALNLLTVGMDALAMAVALTLTYRWGLRTPVWLLVFPMWVATGLLGTIALAAPLGFLATAVSGSPVSASSDSFLQPWVYGVVYAGFTGQGLGLVTAFVLHLRARWPRLFSERVRGLGAGALAPVQRVLGNGLAAIAVLIGAVDLYWAGGGTAGLNADAVAGRTVTGQTEELVFGLLALTAAAGTLVLVRRRGRVRLWVPLAAAWLGSGSLFAWGLWGSLALALSPFQHPSQSNRPTPLVSLTVVFQTLDGALLALLTLVVLLEGLAANRARTSA
ncbi:hypothetical protein [Streptacidiphilus sp. EB129]|uniref:hypothetical protein n=1 Tax=Streptacidiphilus sp. EB129 TaxID=3156262 RepID=UPI003516E1D4